MTRWLVVGGGSAGCVVAARLSEDESNDVTLLEAGTGGDAALAATVIRGVGSAPTPYLQGRGLGGSSLINGGVAVGSPEGWERGHDLPVEPAVVGPVGAAVLAATPDAGPVGVIGRSGRRVSAADAYLGPIDRSNLHVRTGVRVDRLVLDGRRVVGAATGDEQIAADRVALCAGAIESPAILLRSGVDTPGVGEGLQDHAGVAFSFELVGEGDTGAPIGVTVERPGRQIVVLERLADAPAHGALLAGHLAVTSCGSVTLADDGTAVASLGQLVTSADRDGLALVAGEALGLVRELAASGAVGDVFVDEHGTGVAALDDAAALRRWLPSHPAGYHHVAGSCHRALRPDGGLIEYDGAFVCDASALPGPPARNPYLTLIRHAEATSRRWRADLT